MRAQRHTHVVAAALVALTFVAGCGDSKDTNVIFDPAPPATPGGPTPTSARTSTPVNVRTATPVATATPTSAGGGATPSPTPSGSAVNADVQTVVSDILPFLTVGPTLLSGGSVSALTLGSASTANAVGSIEDVKNDACPDGGSRVDDEGLPVRTITLTTCDVSDPQLGSFEFNGTITITLSLTQGSITFDFTAKDIPHNHTVHFAGTLSGAPQLSGFILTGPVTIMTPEGNFTLQLNDITINSNHKLISGSGSASDDNDNFDIATIDMTVNSGGQSANFTVTFDDASVHTYVLNLQSGQLTQTS